MPLYEYQCKACGHVFEKIKSFSGPEEKECPICKSEVERLLSAPAVQFKGSGWYVTDYASKGGNSRKTSSASGENSGSKPAENSSSSSASSSSSITSSKSE